MNSRKAQAFMTDFMASVAIFGAMLTLFMTMWSLGVDSQESFDSEELLQEQAERTADFLVTTQGYPENWEEEGVEPQIPGFATSENILSMQKINAFNNLSYERQRELTRTQNFTLQFRDPQTGEVLETESETGEGGGEEEEELGNAIGEEPVAYMTQSGNDFTDIELLDNLNESGVEWYFYYPSTENQDELDSLTAEEVYTNEGSGRDMMQKMISDSADQGWSQFTRGDRIPAARLSMLGDLDNDGEEDIVYKYDDRMYIYDIEEDSTELIETVPEFSRPGSIADFTEDNGNEIAYIDDDNDAIAFYNRETDSITTTGVEAEDIGGAAEIGGENSVFFVDGDDNLAYYSRENGVTETSATAQIAGGSGDIDSDGEQEVAFMDDNGDLAFYQISSDSTETTSETVQDVGGISDGKAAMISNSNDDAGFWNYSSSNFEEIGFPAERVSGFTERNGGESLLYLDIEENQDITFYNTETGLKEYVRDDTENGFRADESGSYRIEVPGYGEAVAYIDSNGYINFYLVDQETTVRLDQRADYIGGGGDLDSDDVEELPFVDNDGRDLEYYDFETASTVNAVQGGTNVRSRDIGESGDMDGDGVDETSLMVDSTSNAGYYDFNDDSQTDLGTRIDSLGGVGDITLDGSPEITYVKDGDLAYYNVAEDEEVETGAAAEYAGGAGDIAGNSRPEIIFMNEDQNMAYYNPETGETTEETARIRAVGSMMQLNEDDGFDGIATHNDNNLGYYDFSLNRNFNTVIAENTAVESNTVSNGEILQRAVEDGMTYYHSRESLTFMTDFFGLETQEPGSDTGEVQQVEPLISSEFEVGDEVPFSEVDTGLNPDDVDEVFVNSTASPDACMACGINYGDGKVYYITDVSIEDSSVQPSLNQPGEVIASPGTDTGKTNPFNVGVQATESAETVINIDRQVAVNQSGELQKAELKYVVWR